MPNRPNNLTAEQRRAATVEAVIALAGQQNPSDITTAAIAEQMSVTQGALFRHFPNKEAIWAAVTEWVAERLLTRIDDAATGAATPTEALAAIFHSHIDFVAAHPGVPRVMLSELQQNQLTPAKRTIQTLIQHYAQRLAALLNAGKLSGELSAQLNTQDAATLFIGTVQGLVMQALLAGEVKLIRQQAAGVFAIYQRGIGSQP